MNNIASVAVGVLVKDKKLLTLPESTEATESTERNKIVKEMRN